jgi:hypothetical protein
MSLSGKQTSAEIERARIRAVKQNTVVRVVTERSDRIKTISFRKEPTARILTNQQFVDDCLKHPERFAEGGPKRSQSRTWLHQVIFLQDLEAVNALIKAGQDVNAKDDLGRTALHYASSIGSRPIVETLLKKGSFKDVELADKMGYKPLHLASEGGYHGVIEALIKEGEADVNSAGPDGFQPLHLICQAGRSVACFAALLTVGELLDLKDQDMYGRTPQDILRDIMGKGNKRANEAKAVRKDKRGPWKLLNAAISHEIKRRKDQKYLRYQDIEEKEREKQLAKDRDRARKKKKIEKAMAIARAAIERGEKVDWSALGLDPDMEDELMASMAGDDGDDDDEEEEEEEEEEEGDSDSDNDDNEEGNEGDDGREPAFPQDYVNGGGDAGKMQMAAMAMSVNDDDEEEDDEGKEENSKNNKRGGKEAEEVTDEKPTLLEDSLTVMGGDDSDDGEELQVTKAKEGEEDRTSEQKTVENVDKIDEIKNKGINVNDTLTSNKHEGSKQQEEK